MRHSSLTLIILWLLWGPSMLEALLGLLVLNISQKAKLTVQFHMHISGFTLRTRTQLSEYTGMF